MIPITRDMCLAAAQKAGGEVRFDLWPLQLGLGGHPWRVAVASVLLNRTSHRQARPALRQLLATWPAPEMLATADPWEVSRVVHRCGFGARRTKTLCALSRAWCGDGWRDMRELPGIGPYIADAVGLLCFGCTEVESGDRAMVAYAEEVERGRQQTVQGADR